MSVLGAKKQEKDWKEKYFQTLELLDEQEKTLESSENELTKFILKLTFSHTGTNSELDKKLKQFRNDLRTAKDKQKRKNLINDIVEAVIKQSEKNEQDNSTQQGSYSNPLTELLKTIQLDSKYQHEIRQFKTKAENCEDTDEANKQAKEFGKFFNEISKASESSNSTKKTVDTKHDDFAEFLNRLSLPGETGIQIRRLRNRIQDISEEKDRIKIIDQVVETLNRIYKSEPKFTVEQNNDFEMLLQLLEWITIPENFKEEFAEIKQELSDQTFIMDPAKILKQIGDFISSVNNNLQKELAEMETYLAKVIIRLQEFENHLIGSKYSQQENLVNAQNFNTQMKENAEKLKNDIDSCNNMEEIKITLDSHLEIIDANLDIHFKSEQERQQESQKVIETLAKRVVQIESETERLQNAIIKERQKAHKDALTGISNRLAYEEKIKDEHSRWQRYQQKLSLGLIDIDDFKRINDQYGHSAGDKVLKTVAKLCEEKIRNIDFIARYGGEEFALIFPNTSLTEATTAAENLRLAIEKCVFHYNKKQVPITVSIGLAEFAESDTIESVFQRADKALYTAKGSGKNRCVSEQSDNK